MTSPSDIPPSTPLLTAALAYATLGYQVFPCHTPRPTTRVMTCSCRTYRCPAIGKHPRLRHYPTHATTNPATIHTWWQRWPDANIGILTGAQAGIIVLDNDPYRGDELTFTGLEAQYGPFPETPTALTGGGGQHLLFAYPRVPGLYIPSGRDVLSPGIDIRADGSGYIIAPPSLHLSGKRYQWEINHELGDLSPAPLPQTLIDRLTTPQPTGKRQTRPQTRHKASAQELTSKSSPSGGVPLLVNGALSSFPLPPRLWTSAELTVLLRRPDVVTGCLPLLGCEGVAVGEKFCCVVHKDDHPSASIMPPRAGSEHDTYVYGDHHGTDRQIWPLPVIYWSVKTGKPPEQMSKSSLLVWTVRLLVDAGVLAPASLPALPSLPADAPAEVHTVYQGFRHLLGCRWLYKQDSAPLSFRFGAEWCGVSQGAVGKARKWLLCAGYLVGAGTYPYMGKRMQLFLLGTVDRIRRLAGRVIEAARHAFTAMGDILKAHSRHRDDTPPEWRSTPAWEALRQREARWQAAKAMHGDCPGCDHCRESLRAEALLIERLRHLYETQGPPP